MATLRHVGAVKPQELGFLGGGGGDEAVGDDHNVSFAFNSLLGDTFAVIAGDTVFHQAQGMEHVNDGDVPGVAQLFGDQAGEPIMAVNKIVADAGVPGEIEDALDEFVQVDRLPRLRGSVFAARRRCG